MKFTTEQFRALMNACDERAEKLKAQPKQSRQSTQETKVLEEMAHSFACTLSMIAESERD